MRDVNLPVRAPSGRRRRRLPASLLRLTAVGAFAALAACSTTPADVAVDAPDLAAPPSTTPPQCPAGPLPATLLTDTVWEVPSPSNGLQLSSPRIADLNGDGALDVVVGFGKAERVGGVVALDGRDGATLWQWDVDGEVYATPALVPVDGDAVVDVVVGGRMQDIVALSGADGRELWRMRTANPAVTSQDADTAGVIAIPDRTGDGVPELLASRSGGRDGDRPAGELYLLDGANGVQLARSTTADAGETYTIPVPLPDAGDAAASDPASLPATVYGTGGEERPGDLVASRVSAGGDWPALWTLDAPGGARRGVIATPTVLAGPDPGPGITFTTFDSVIGRLELDGSTVWQRRVPGSATYSSLTPRRTRAGWQFAFGSYVGDEFPPAPDADADVYVVGADDGAPVARIPAPRPLVSSPATVDLDGDGDDEILFTGSDPPYITDESGGATVLAVVDGCRGTTAASREFPGVGASTPTVVDLDGDGGAEIVFAYGRGVAVLRTGFAMPPDPTWPQFLGPDGDATLR